MSRERAIASLQQMINERSAAVHRPLVVAIDGRSGAGKSTLASALAAAVHGTVLEGDDFFAGGVTVREDSPMDRARACIDRGSLARVLEALRHSQAVSYHAFDWDAFDGRLRHDPTHVIPQGPVLVEGVYSAHPELAPLLDLRVLLRVPDEVRDRRLRAREEHLGPWEQQWHEAEDWYFSECVPPAWFDIVVDNVAPEELC